MRIDADSPSGNIIVDRIEDGVAYLRPDPRDWSMSAYRDTAYAIWTGFDQRQGIDLMAP